MKSPGQTENNEENQSVGGNMEMKSVKLCSEIAKRLPKHPSATGLFRSARANSRNSGCIAATRRRPHRKATVRQGCDSQQIPNSRCGRDSQIYPRKQFVPRVGNRESAKTVPSHVAANHWTVSFRLSTVSRGSRIGRPSVSKRAITGSGPIQITMHNPATRNARVSNHPRCSSPPSCTNQDGQEQRRPIAEIRPIEILKTRWRPGKTIARNSRNEFVTLLAAPNT